MPGGAETRLALCGNRVHYVVKCANNRQGPNTLANEVLGAELMKALRLPTAPWRTARYFPKYSPWAVCPFHHSGCDLHFASELIRPSDEGRLYSFLPTAFVHRVINRPDFTGALIFDIWAGSSDVRQALFVEAPRTGSFSAVFIDNGHLFGGPNWKFEMRPGIALCLDRTMYSEPFDKEAFFAASPHHDSRHMGPADRWPAIRRDRIRGPVPPCGRVAQPNGASSRCPAAL